MQFLATWDYLKSMSTLFFFFIGKQIYRLRVPNKYPCMWPLQMSNTVEVTILYLSIAQCTEQCIFLPRLLLQKIIIFAAVFLYDKSTKESSKFGTTTWTTPVWFFSIFQSNLAGFFNRRCIPWSITMKFL